MRELIITNGDSAANLLKEAGIGDSVLPWRDILHEGPVPLVESLEELSDHRAGFIARHYAAPGSDRVRAGFAERDAALADNAAFDLVTLWFEHDLYDQLQLLQILDWFASHPRSDGTLRLVQADDYLGTQTPNTIGRFAGMQVPVDEPMLMLAVRAWRAFRREIPRAWAELLNDDLGCLPFLRASIVRMLEELPDLRNGLSRTARHSVQLLGSEAQAPGLLFQKYGACEEAQFHGDWSFFTVLDSLIDAPAPLIEGRACAAFHPSMSEPERQAYFKSELALTAFGHSVLAGDADHAVHNPPDYWIGGIHVTPANLWRWDPEKRELQAPKE